MTDTARISSDGIFYTVQGEGLLQGVPSVFLRFDTCNLRCKWGETVCDAHYTSWNPGDAREPIGSLVQRVLGVLKMQNCRHLVITGGEPTLQGDALRAVVNAAWRAGVHTTLETNGTRYQELLSLSLACLSPKLKSSTPVGTLYEHMHEKNRWDQQAIRKWMFSNAYFFKFVIDREEDIEEVRYLLDQVYQPLNDPDHVVFMPQGITAQELWEKGRWVAERCKELGVRFSSRLQVDLYGNRPGT